MTRVITGTFILFSFEYLQAILQLSKHIIKAKN